MPAYMEEHLMPHCLQENWMPGIWLMPACMWGQWSPACRWKQLTSGCTWEQLMTGSQWESVMSSSAQGDKLLRRMFPFSIFVWELRLWLCNSFCWKKCSLPASSHQSGAQQPWVHWSAPEEWCPCQTGLPWLDQTLCATASPAHTTKHIQTLQYLTFRKVGLANSMSIITVACLRVKTRGNRMWDHKTHWRIRK